MTGRAIVFYFRGVRANGAAQYRVGGSALNAEAAPVGERGPEAGWRLVTWYPDPAGGGGRHREEMHPGLHPRPCQALADYARARGYAEAFIESRFGLRTTIVPSPPGRADEFVKPPP